MGHGLLESIYEYCLLEELRENNINAFNQVQLPIFYKGKTQKDHFRRDILAEESIIIELKAVEIMISLYEAIANLYKTIRKT